MAKITRGRNYGSTRYEYDFGKCSSKDGWAQLDTRQDASYYGNWVNPITLKLFSYCEGDVAVTECDDDADFVQTVRECVDCHKESGYFIGIDAMCVDRITDAFKRLGLGELLH